MTDDRQQREFNDGLSEEVDAWLRGDTSRRTFLTRFMLLGGAAMVPGLGYTASGSKAWAAMADVSKVELADKSTPLGHAQADAVNASTEGPQDGSAYRAVAAAKQFKGKGHHDLTYEAGLQALEPHNFSGPLWQDLTGITFNVVELPPSRSVFQADRRAHRQSGAYDVIDIEPPGSCRSPIGGVIAADRRLRRQIYEQGGSGRLPSAVQVPCRLTRASAGASSMMATSARSTTAATFSRTPSSRRLTGRNSTRTCACRRAGTNTFQVAQFITDQLAPNVYGAAHFRKAGSPGNQFAFPSSSAPTAAHSSTADDEGAACPARRA